MLLQRKKFGGQSTHSVSCFVFIQCRGKKQQVHWGDWGSRPNQTSQNNNVFTDVSLLHDEFALTDPDWAAEWTDLLPTKAFYY